MLAANDKKLHENIQKSKDVKEKNRLRMVSLTQSYNLNDSPQFIKARLMSNVLEKEEYEK